MLPRHLLVDVYVIETASEDSRVRSPSAIPYLHVGMTFIVLSVIEMSMMKNANTTKLCLNFGDP